MSDSRRKPQQSLLALAELSGVFTVAFAIIYWWPMWRLPYASLLLVSHLVLAIRDSWNPQLPILFYAVTFVWDAAVCYAQWCISNGNWDPTPALDVTFPADEQYKETAKLVMLITFPLLTIFKVAMNQECATANVDPELRRQLHQLQQQLDYSLKMASFQGPGNTTHGPPEYRYPTQPKPFLN